MAAVTFVVRGPVRFAQARDFNDFISPYIQARAFVLGLDPYSPDVMVRLWPAYRFKFLETPQELLVINHGIPTAYPLTCLLLLTPFAFLSWPVAHWAWLLVNFALVIGVIWTLAAASFKSGDRFRYLFTGFALALAPLQTGFAVGNAAIPTIALCGLAFVYSVAGNELWAGLLIGTAVCLKPQIGLAFVIFYFWRRRWLIVKVATVFTMILTATGIIRLLVSGTSWYDSYRMTNRVLLTMGILSDFTERNPMRFSLINLQVLFYALFNRAALANILAIATAATLFLAWLALCRHHEKLDGLLMLSAVVVISLLPLYHRSYDAFLLVFPLCWAIKALRTSEKNLALASLALLSLFLVPGPSALYLYESKGWISHQLAASWLWNAFVLAHQIWALLILSLFLLYASFRQVSSPLSSPVTHCGANGSR